MGGGRGLFWVKTIFVSSAIIPCYFFSRFKAKINFLDKVKASCFSFCCCFFDNHLIQPNHPELLIQAY